MQELAAYFRFMQLYAHNCHNLVYGEDFFPYHEFLGELYSKYEELYDSVVERSIGLGLQINLTDVQVKAVMLLQKENYQFQSPLFMFKAIQRMEKQFCQMINGLIPSSTEGTKQLLGGMADDSEVRQYKLKQLLKPEAASPAYE